MHSREMKGERYSIIKNIIDTSAYLETVSGKCPTNYSNIYQTFTLSFIKFQTENMIYPESTLIYSKKSLTLVIKSYQRNYNSVPGHASQ